MTKPFTHKHSVGFADCDMAGIVFYPRYFEMINAVVEGWFKHALDLPFRELHQDRKRAIPAVEINTRFTAMSRIDDDLTFHLSVKNMGSSSLTLAICGECDGEARLEADVTIVQVNMETGAATPWPDDWKERMTA